LLTSRTHARFYERVWEGALLAADDYVISADEKNEYSSPPPESAAL